VNLNNVRIEQFPDVFIAKLFHFKPFDLLEFEEADLTDVSVKNYLNNDRVALCHTTATRR
jgi:Uncharacterized conserved protein